MTRGEAGSIRITPPDRKDSEQANLSPAELSFRSSIGNEFFHRLGLFNASLFAGLVVSRRGNHGDFCSRIDGIHPGTDTMCSRIDDLTRDIKLGFQLAQSISIGTAYATAKAISGEKDAIDKWVVDIEKFFKSGGKDWDAVRGFVEVVGKEENRKKNS
ncbi:unnamed protein product [Tuber aestivum]|uniref:Uncharacterized protein n=1 Tax=Tuber aestivum TaxID=59557 RepID=A0A292Q815_9PEZI|nr:unnamed protein product [Tuber aestivum]